MKVAEKPKITSSPIAKKSVGKPVSDYYEPIPISNLDSLDIFDPMYLEDIEIQNEDNLSLTVHRWDHSRCRGIECRDEDPDPMIFGPTESVLFSTDPDPTCNNGFIRIFILNKI